MFWDDFLTFFDYFHKNYKNIFQKTLFFQKFKKSSKIDPKVPTVPPRADTPTREGPGAASPRSTPPQGVGALASALK